MSGSGVDGLFETTKVVAGVPFALTRHLARLRRSADAIGLDLRHDEALRAGVAEVIAANEPDVGRLRITVTRGPDVRGDAGPALGTTVIATGPSPDWGPTTDVITLDRPRNEHSPVAGLKTTSALENLAGVRRARASGATEALLPNLAGDLCEGTASNVFVGVGGRLLTPPLASGCLPGVTRALVLEVTDAVEERMSMAVLDDADEVFITSSTRDVHPVASIDGRPLPVAPGPLTAASASAFRALENATPDP